MSKGRAANFAQDVFDYEVTFNQRMYQSWEEFQAKFMEEFYPLAETETAANTLEGRGYFQGRRSMDDYLDTFRDLIVKARISCPRTVVAKFRRGLEPSLQTAINTLPVGRPGDDDPNPWYQMARQLYQARLSDAVFTSHTAATFGRAFPSRQGGRGIITLPPASRGTLAPTSATGQTGTQSNRTTTTAQPQPVQQRFPHDRRPQPQGTQPQRQPFRTQPQRQGFNIRALDIAALEDLANEISARMDKLQLGAQPEAVEEMVEEDLLDLGDEDFLEQEG